MTARPRRDDSAARLAELARPRPDPTTALHEVLNETDRLEQAINDLLSSPPGTAAPP